MNFEVRECVGMLKLGTRRMRHEGCVVVLRIVPISEMNVDVVVQERSASIILSQSPGKNVRRGKRTAELRHDTYSTVRLPRLLLAPIYSLLRYFLLLSMFHG